MNIIQNLTNAPKQQMTLILEDGTQIALTIRFIDMQYGWFMDEISYGDVTIEGRRICTSPNMLQQFKNLVPFGLACFTKDNNEPRFQEDFSSGYATLYVLTAAEVDALTLRLRG